MPRTCDHQVADQICAMVADRRMLAHELPGPLRMLHERIRGINRRYCSMGSHWRIVGRRVIDRDAGEVMEYRYVMVNLGGNEDANTTPDNHAVAGRDATHGLSQPGQEGEHGAG